LTSVLLPDYKVNTVYTITEKGGDMEEAINIGKMLVEEGLSLT